MRAGISSLLAENQIGSVFVSTIHTDYILVKKKHAEKAKQVLTDAGYEFLES